MDVNGGTNYSHMGTNQMMSVPYALFAENADIDYDSISTLLSNDSAFITTVSRKMRIGNCMISPFHPEGLDGIEYVRNLIPYTVPSGKTFYMRTELTNLEINGNNSVVSGSHYFNIPIKENSILDWSGGTTSLRGYLIDKDYEVVNYVPASGTYTIPNDSYLYILNSLSDLTVNSFVLQTTNGISQLFKPPYILQPSDVVSSNLGFNALLIPIDDCNTFNGSSSATMDSLSQFISVLDSTVNVLTSQINFGCTDVSASNYNNNANIDDGSCIYPIYGCTDATAFNYNPLATIDDGSCVAPASGCTDSTALNYNANANIDDGSCVYDIYGCTNATAFNYNPLATVDDGSCVAIISGCIDPTALNYNPLANTDDGSCIPGNLVIGDFFRGGIIFYFDGNGGGLIAAPADQATVVVPTHISYGPEWCTYNTSGVNGADGVIVGTGLQNTIDIVNSNCNSIINNPIAAEICYNLNLGGYNDWYLPSINELELMYLNIGQGSSVNAGGFNPWWYWSSTESQFSANIFGWLNYAYRIDFGGSINNYGPFEDGKNTSCNVRAIRAF